MVKKEHVRRLLSWALLLVLPTVVVTFSPATCRPSKQLLNAANKNDEDSPIKTLNVAIVGAGPSGLLLAHRLLQAGHKVSLFETRSDPRLADIEGRAYALGLGIRGRTAIQSCDQELWHAVKERGYESERFDLHINSRIKIRLRDVAKNSNVEPSLLLYQTDLCAALLDELEKRHSNNCNVKFNARVKSVDTDTSSLSLQEDESKNLRAGPFDVIAGCDGVNSIVRKSINNPNFQQSVNALPGEFKVCRCTTMPPKIDPTSVALILPKSGSTTLFVEPTKNREGCILFAGRDSDDPILTGSISGDDLLERFPLLEGMDLTDIVSQLEQQKPSRASSVQCNIYHCGNLVLCGDAAHATGGVSGQGVNSALMDSAVLADCLSEQDVDDALLTYSQRQVPEGKALYDLSFGSGNISPFTKIRSLLATARDTIFQGRFGIGRPPVQTLLTTSLTPFADIRRDRDVYFSETFPDTATLRKSIAEVYDESNV